MIKNIIIKITFCMLLILYSFYITYQLNADTLVNYKIKNEPFTVIHEIENGPVIFYSTYKSDTNSYSGQSIKFTFGVKNIENINIVHFAKNLTTQVGVDLKRSFEKKTNKLGDDNSKKIDENLKPFKFNIEYSNKSEINFYFISRGYFHYGAFDFLNTLSKIIPTTAEGRTSENSSMDVCKFLYYFNNRINIKAKTGEFLDLTHMKVFVIGISEDKFNAFTEKVGSNFKYLKNSLKFEKSNISDLKKYNCSYIKNYTDLTIKFDSLDIFKELIISKAIVREIIWILKNKFDGMDCAAMENIDVSKNSFYFSIKIVGSCPEKKLIISNISHIFSYLHHRQLAGFEKFFRFYTEGIVNNYRDINRFSFNTSYYDNSHSFDLEYILTSDIINKNDISEIYKLWQITLDDMRNYEVIDHSELNSKN